MKPIIHTLLTTFVLAAAARSAHAQEVAAYLGLGGAHASSNGAQIDTFGDGNLYKTPSLGGLFADIGGSAFFNKHFGAGGEITWRPSQADYAGIPYRPTFYTFDALFRLQETSKKIVPEFRAGIGGARLTFFPSDDLSCAQVPGCPASHHFQEHLGASFRWYLSDHLFLRPAFDLNHVQNLFEFGHGWVPRYSVSVGYSLGRQSAQ